MVKASVYKYVKEFQGEPQRTDLQLVKEDLPPLKNGEFLAEAIFLSVDPYMRAYAKTIGSTMIGSQLAKITESRNPSFPVGELVVGSFGWRTHTITNAEDEMKPYIFPKIGNLSPSLSLGVLGMPGNTAYFGFLEICHPKPGETVVVSGAAGAVGSLVGQIAKIKGCKVIGIAGSADKNEWLVKELGFDHTINYKTENVGEKLSRLAPKGVDCYFDNVGGKISSIVIEHMNKFGRISSCGAISQYNKDKRDSGFNQLSIISKELKIEGFIVTRWMDRWMEGILQMAEWIKQGKIKYRETVTEGFENMFDAFANMLKGNNVGKAVVKV